MKRFFSFAVSLLAVTAGIAVASTATSHSVAKVDRIEGIHIFGGAGPCAVAKTPYDYLCNAPSTGCSTGGKACTSTNQNCPNAELTKKNANGWSDSCGSAASGKNTCSSFVLYCTVTQTCGLCEEGWVDEDFSWICGLTSQVPGGTQTGHGPSGGACP